ncbi:MAG TPA: hypothetical protein VEJ18_12655, partial [Planctomycetota bacterium]|nr:hypothetical protein [Planctomycetota bacterium]
MAFEEGHQGSDPSADYPGVAHVLSAVRMAVAQLRLYPPDSPQVAKTVALVFPVVDAWLRRSGSLALTSASEGLLVDGQRVPAGDAAAAAVEQFTLAALRESRVPGVRLNAGLTSAELVAFLHAWAHRFWELPDAAAINARLRESAVEHAAIEEVAYVAVGKDGL